MAAHCVGIDAVVKQRKGHSVSASTSTQMQGTASVLMQLPNEEKVVDVNVEQLRRRSMQVQSDERATHCISVDTDRVTKGMLTTSASTQL